MRLVNTRTLELEEFFDTSTPNYAILSHTWEKEEVIFSDMTDLGKARWKYGFAKLEGACHLAATQGYDYIWIDTCCIDKSSSAELSEAINSMYIWYACSAVCYAYLSDVDNRTQIGDSRWFTRGWTLQELIAPRFVEFYAADWAYLGNNPSLISTISRASRVDERVLARQVDPLEVSVAKRMYWASGRTTTRLEDEAYCMMGLFGVNMPLLYGEGDKAFLRLQQEITKVTHDQSILAWYCAPSESDMLMHYPSSSLLGFFAPSPSCFALSGNITTSVLSWDGGGGLGPIDITRVMTQFSAVLKPGASDKPLVDYEVILQCEIGPVPGTFATLLLRRDFENPEFYDRTLYPGIVSKTSLYTFQSHLAQAKLNTKTISRLGLEIARSPCAPADGTSPLMATVKGRLRKY
jgi:hypothetical protein